MRHIEANLFRTIVQNLAMGLQQEGHQVYVGEWQSQRGEDSPFFHTIELQDVSIHYPVPTMNQLHADVQPNLPWAEDHFLERVSGQPLNPPPSHEWWPFARKSNDEHREEEKFSHTYPERMWPKFANIGEVRPNGRQVYVPHNGIRYELGDLNDLVNLLVKSPATRQAYLPIWFPEDTGAVDGQRVPCTLGYHFMFREEKLNITYYMRSCDFLRHFADDVYMACRLVQWVCAQIQERHLGAELAGIRPGTLNMHISSLHIFEGPDEVRVNQLAQF